MKKLISILTAFLFVFALVSCSGDSSDSSSVSASYDESKLSSECVAIGIADYNEDPRPEFSDELNIPSNENMVECICNKIITTHPNMTNKELTEWWENDPNQGGYSVEGREKIDIALNCAGFDSFEDFVSKVQAWQMKKIKDK